MQDYLSNIVNGEFMGYWWHMNGILLVYQWGYSSTRHIQPTMVMYGTSSLDVNNVNGV